ncbi:MAG: hypothetical protein LBG11_02025 [Bifidobacteriaceae bacterium]|nr:hypothetical protein [Bifidobacteriaceae bacterium]
MDTLSGLAAAVGCHMEVSFKPREDPGAVDAYLMMAGEMPEVGGVETWTALLEAAGAHRSLATALWLTALHSPPGQDAAGPEDFRKTLGIIDGAAGRHDWLVSGAEALAAAGVDRPGPLVVYTDHLDDVKRALAVSPGNRQVKLLALSPEVWAGRQILGASERWVGFWLAVLDTVRFDQTLVTSQDATAAFAASVEKMVRRG